MSTEYSDRKIKEILARVNGQGKLAEQAIVTLVQRDPQFLLSLVHPYLSGIILHGIERARKQPAGAAPSPVTRPQPLPKKTATAKAAPKAVSGNTMDNLMKALAKGFDEQSDTPAAKGKTPGKVSQSHLDALQAMIKPKSKH